MHYVYILWSSKSKIFYYGYTHDLKKRFREHNEGISKATKPHRPWRLVFYSAFESSKKAKDFELYIKSGSGKAFVYKRLVNEALKKDALRVTEGVPKPSSAEG
jgi:predicted GIY-YIG superfamily endonuclease